jgi:periplasmic divalent cation tolerance protein
MKTRSELFASLRDRVRELHSYEVEEIIALPIIAGNPPYLDWIKENTQR